MQTNRISKTASYKDILKNYKPADTHAPYLKQAKQPHRGLQLKKSNVNRQDKQNQQSKRHLQSMRQKSPSTMSMWVQQDVLKEYNNKRKDKQLQLSYHKFINYITTILQNLTGYVPPQLLTMKITYLQYLAALKQMSFIKDTYQPSPHDSVSQLWSDLVSNNQTIGVFILFIASILNMRRNNQEFSQNLEYLSKRYSDLRYTRMQMLGKTKTMPNDQQNYSFTPNISQRSRTLAGSRSKSKGVKDRCFAQKSYNQTMEEDSEESLFANQKQKMQTLIGNKRSQILYQLAKERSQQKKKDKKSNDVQYEKAAKQLTFHPKIHPNMKEKPKKAIQGQQNSINRMIRGRVQRQVRKIINDKGLPYNEKMFQKMKRERYQALLKQKEKEREKQYYFYHNTQSTIQNISKLQHNTSVQLKQKSKKNTEPIVLTIQVDQDRCEKLVIQDRQNYKEAAAKFIKDFNLKPEMYEKLIDGVEKALKFQLTQVDQDSCESEQQSIQ